ncbi:unnamed protein product, partial [Adineta ricciae]
MKAVLDKFPQVAAHAEEAIRRAGVEPLKMSIRGGYAFAAQTGYRGCGRECGSRYSQGDQVMGYDPERRPADDTAGHSLRDRRICFRGKVYHHFTGRGELP